MSGKNSCSQVMVQNSLNQSKSILTSVELVSQICLFVGLCVCLFLCMLHHFLRMTEYIFLKLCIWNFQALLRWSEPSKNSHLLGYFCPFLSCFFFFFFFCTLLFFLSTVKHFLMKFCKNFLGITLIVTTQKCYSMALSAGIHLGVIWGSF